MREASILISSECLWQLHREICGNFSRNRVSLTICPEREGCKGIVSKLATIIRTSNPKDFTVLTMEGSPHCFLLHTSVLQALFLTGMGIKSRHFVLLEGIPLEIQPDAIRTARYLHLVDRIIRK
ncbi:4Fe-4S ferredoxin, partial [Candidatus Bathyarchaeota archaeon]|nr:4Fe-4S ferredoxin [Candidatus Bathyarchaeota archaeon]